MRLDIKPTDRVHMTVWRAYPSAEGDPGWRAAEAVNGCPIRFGDRFDTWAEALTEALERAEIE